MNTLAYLAFVSAFVISLAARTESIGEKFTSFAGFELGAVELADVQKVLGNAKIVETGDAGEYTASICYVVPNGVVLFFAGELDGPKHNLGGFGFAKETDRRPCAEWTASLATPNLFIGGIKLGLSLEEFTNIVGAPVRMEGNKAYTFFENKRTMTEKEILRLPKEVQAMVKRGEQQNYFDVVISIIATFSNGHLEELKIWKTETT